MGVAILILTTLDAYTGKDKLQYTIITTSRGITNPGPGWALAHAVNMDVGPTNYTELSYQINLHAIII